MLLFDTAFAYTYGRLSYNCTVGIIAEIFNQQNCQCTCQLFAHNNNSNNN